MLRSEIHKLSNYSWNKAELPRQWWAGKHVTYIYMKDNKSNSIVEADKKFISFFSKVTSNINQMTGDEQPGFKQNR
jgi:hypothetical protein